MRLFSLHISWHIWFVDRPTEHDNGSSLSSVQVTHGKSLRTVVICSSPGSTACHFLTHSAFSANTFPSRPQIAGVESDASRSHKLKWCGRFGEIVSELGSLKQLGATWATQTTSQHIIMADAKTQKLMEDLGLKKKDIDGLFASLHKQHFCS